MKADVTKGVLPKPMIVTSKQNKFLNALIRNNYNITKTCKAIKMSRKFYYQWLDDPAFKKQMDTYREREVDMIEDAFKDLVHEKNPQTVIFGLKTRAASRGYQEKQAIEHFGAAGIKIEIIDPNQKKEKTVEEVEEDE